MTEKEGCNAVVQRKLPAKLKDPGSYTIPCEIGAGRIGKSLYDLGASINLMLFSLYKRLKIGGLKPTFMSIRMADRMATVLMRIVEDVLVKVHDLLFLVDFLILEMREVEEVPIILGRPFVAETI